MLVDHAIAIDVPNVQVVAHYSNIQSYTGSDPHQSGYAVVIYKRHDGYLFGDFTYAPGSTEGSGGRLLDLRIDGKRISFKAKTSSAYDATNRRPTRELFEFKGIFDGNALIGILTLWNGYATSEPQSKQQVKLKREKIAMPLSYEAHQKIFPSDAW